MRKMIKAKVIVTLKDDVMDPQGQAVSEAIGSMGYRDVKSVRVGRYFDIELDTDDENEAKKQLDVLSDKLLANTVIEHYVISTEKC